MSVEIQTDRTLISEFRIKLITIMFTMFCAVTD